MTNHVVYIINHKSNEKNQGNIDNLQTDVLLHGKFKLEEKKKTFWITEERI